MDQLIDLTISQSDFDLATLLYELYKDSPDSNDESYRSLSRFLSIHVARAIGERASFWLLQAEAHNGVQSIIMREKSDKLMLVYYLVRDHYKKDTIIKEYNVVYGQSATT